MIHLVWNDIICLVQIRMIECPEKVSLVRISPHLIFGFSFFLITNLSPFELSFTVLITSWAYLEINSVSSASTKYLRPLNFTGFFLFMHLTKATDKDRKPIYIWAKKLNRGVHHHSIISILVSPNYNFRYLLLD